jgi:type VI secretion system secreted protein VgrG
LGSAQSFAVLGGAGTTVAGAAGTIVSGNLGDYPLALASITGFPTPGTVIDGSIFAADQMPLIAEQAQADANTAYAALAALASTANETGVTLGTGGTVSTLLPGVYTFSSTAEVDGSLTLDFNGGSNLLFVFQVGTTLTTGAGASINVTGGNSTDSIYWELGTAATLGASTMFAGNILAATAITLDPGAEILCGRAFAGAAVTMAGNNLVSDNCGVTNLSNGDYSAAATTDFGSYGFSGVDASAPEPGTFLLLGLGLVALGTKYAARKR